MSDRVSSHFDKPEQFRELLEAAEAANQKGDAGDFVQEMREKYARWGAGMFLSGKQKAWLERIAGETA